MTSPNPPAGQAVTDHHAGHAAPHGLLGDVEHLLEQAEARIVAAVREAGTPGRLQELATLTREVVAGARDGAEVLAWLSVHGL